MAKYTSQYTFGVSADTTKAQSALNTLTKSLQTISKKKYSLQVEDASIERASNAAFQLQQQLIAATNVNTGKIDFSKLDQGLQKAGTNVNKLGQDLLACGSDGQRAFSQLANAIATAEAPTRRLNTVFTQLGTTLMNTIKWQASSSLIHGLMSSVSSAISYVKNLNSTLTDIRVVTGASADEMARFAESANATAKRLSASTQDVAKASLIFYQQGDSAAMAAKKAEIVTKAANVAFTASARELSEMLTAVWNSFQMGEDELEHAADVLAKLGANTASSMEEMMKAMQKVAATANTVGVSMDQMSAIVATAASVTRQAPETIGTAWNTVLGRISNLKLGETLEDGVDLTKYTKALQSIGVSVLDANGELRNMGVVVDEIGEKWQTLNQAQKSALAATIGGVRQYTQINAFFENFDKYKQNLKDFTGDNATGALNEQQEIYASGWEAASQRVQTAMQDLYKQLINDQAMTKLSDFFSGLINTISSVTKSFGGAGNVIALLATQIAQTHLDTFATKLTEIGTSFKQLFSGNTEINEYAQRLQEMRQSLSSMTTDDMAPSLQTELQYDSEILKIKQMIAEKQGTLTAQQKEELNVILQQVQAAKEHYTTLQKQAEAISQRAAETKKNAAQELRESKAQSLYKENTKIDGADLKKEAYSVQKEWLAQANKAFNGLDVDTKSLDGASEKIQTLGQLMDKLKVDAGEVTVDTLVETLTRAAEEAGKAEGTLNQFKSAFENIQTGQIDFNNFLGNPEEAITLIKEQLATIKLPEGEATPEWMTTLQNLTQVDASNLDTVNAALKELSTALDENQVSANQDLTALESLLKNEGLDDNVIKKIITDFKNLGASGVNTEKLAADVTKNFKTIEKSVESSMTKATNKVKAFTSFAITLSRISSTITAVGNALDKWNDPNVSLWEKFTTIISTFVTIAMTLSSVMNLVNTSTTLSNAISSASAAIKTVEAGAWTIAATAVREFWKALGPVGWAIAAITALVAVVAALVAIFKNYETEEQKMAKKRKEAIASYDTLKKQQEKQKTSLKSLADVIKDTNLTLSEQLDKINAITSAMGLQVDAIDLLGTSYQGLNKKLLSTMRSEQAEIIKSADQAAGQMADNIGFNPLSQGYMYEHYGEFHDQYSPKLLALGQITDEEWESVGLEHDHAGTLTLNYDHADNYDADAVRALLQKHEIDESLEEAIVTYLESENVFSPWYMDDSLNGGEASQRFGESFFNAALGSGYGFNPYFSYDSLTSTGQYNFNLSDAGVRALMERNVITPYDLDTAYYGEDAYKHANYTFNIGSNLSWEDLQGLFTEHPEWFANGEDLIKRNELQTYANTQHFIGSVLNQDSETIDLLGINGSASLSDLNKILQAGATASGTDLSSMDWSVVSDAVSWFKDLPAYQEAAAKFLSIGEQAARVSYNLKQKGQEGQNLSQTQIQQMLINYIDNNTDGITWEELITIRPSAIHIDTKNSTITIDPSAKEVATLTVKANELQVEAENIASLRELKNDQLTKEDYQTVVDSGLFGSKDNGTFNDTEFNRFMMMNKNERIAWLDAREQTNQNAVYANNQALIAARKAEAEVIKREIEDYESTHEGIKDKQQRYHQAKAQFNTADTMIGLKDTDFSQLTDDQKWQAYQWYKQVWKFDGSYADFGEDNWKAMFDSNNINTALEARESARSQVSELEGEVTSYENLTAAQEENAAVVKTLSEENAAIDYDKDFIQPLNKATSAVSIFTEAMSKQGELTGAELTKIAEYTGQNIETILAKYNNMSSAEWAKFMYESAVPYYDQMIALYEGDAAKQQEFIQEKKAAEQSYRDTVEDIVTEVAKIQTEKYNEIRTAAGAVSDALKDIASGTKQIGDMSFEETEKLRQNLMTVYKDAEQVDNLLKNLGKEDLSGQDKESILAAAKLKTEMLLESAAATEAERSQMYGGLASEMQSRIDSTRQVDINNKATIGGEYTLTINAPDAWDQDSGMLTVDNPKTGTHDYTVKLAQAPNCKGYDPTSGILTIEDAGGMTYHVNIGQGTNATKYDPATGILTISAGPDVQYKVNIGKGAQAVGYDDTTGIVTLTDNGGMTYHVQLGGAELAAAKYNPQAGTITLTDGGGTDYTIHLKSDATDVAIFNPQTGVYTVKSASGDLKLKATIDDTSGLTFDPTNGVLKTTSGEVIQLDASLEIDKIVYDEETNKFNFETITGEVVYSVSGVEGLSKDDAGSWKFNNAASGEVKYTLANGSDTPPATGTVEVTDQVTYEVVEGEEPPAEKDMTVNVTYKENNISNMIATRERLAEAWNAAGTKKFEDTARNEARLRFSDMTSSIVNQYGGDIGAYAIGTRISETDISKNIQSIGKEVTRQFQKFIDQAGGDIQKAWELASADDGFMAGYNLFVGLADGYKMAFGTYGSVFTDTSTDLLSYIKTSLGEASPSKFTREMGMFLMEGLSEGFANTDFTGANGLQQRVLNKIKSELDGISQDQLIGTLEGKLGLGASAGDANAQFANMATKGYGYITNSQGKIQLTHNNKILDEVYENLDDAYSAFLTTEFSSDKLTKYLKGEYRDDLTALQQYALNNAMDEALKKYNAQHKTDYKLNKVLDVDPGGFADLVQEELNKSNATLLSQTKTTVSQVQDMWVGVLDNVYSLEQSTIQKVVDSWKNAWSAIIKARKTIWQENTSLFASLGEAEMKEVIRGWREAGYSPEQIRSMALATDGSGARAVTADPYVNSGLQQLGDAAYLNYDSSGRYTNTTFAEWKAQKETSLRESASANQNETERAFNKSVFGDETINAALVAQIANANSDTEVDKILQDNGIKANATNRNRYLAAAEKGTQNGGLAYNETTQQWEAILKFEDIVDKWVDQQMGTDIEQQEAYQTAVDAAQYNDINYASTNRQSIIDQGEGYLTQQQKDLEILNTVAEGLAEGKTLAEIFADNEEDWNRFNELMDGNINELDDVAKKSAELAAAMQDCATAVQIAAQMITNGMADSAVVNADGSVTATKTVKNDDGSTTTTDYQIGADGKLLAATATTVDTKTIQANQQTEYGSRGYTVTQNETTGEYTATKTIKVENLDVNSIDLPEGAETGNTTIDNGTKLTATQQKEINTNYATNAGFSSLKELEEYTDHLKEIGELTEEDTNEALRLAAGLARQNKGFQSAQKNMKTYMETLSKTDKRSTEYCKTLEDVRDIYADVYDFTADQANNLSNDFLESAENAKLLEKAAEGDEEAWDELSRAVADDLLTVKEASDQIIDSSGLTTTMEETMTSIQDWLDENDLKVGAELNDADFLNQCETLINNCARTAEEASAALSSMGVDATIEEHTMTVPISAKQTRIDNGFAEYAWYDADGGLHTESIPLNAQVTTTEGGQVFKWYTIKGAKYNGKGVTHGGSGSPSTGSSSGGSKSSAKKVQSYKKGADEKERYHEITKRLDEQSKELTRLDKLKARTFGSNHLAAIQKEIAALEKEVDLYADLGKEASVNLEANKKILESYGATFNEDGTINYDEYMDKILAEYNAAVDAYNASAQDAGDELALQKAEEIYNEAKKAMEDYEEDMNKLNEAQENMLENQNKISAAMLEGIQYKIEIKLDLNDRDIKYMQYLRDAWEDYLDKQDESFKLMTDEAQKYTDNLKTLETAMNEMSTAYNNGTLNQADYATGMKDINDKMLEQLNNLLTIKKSIKEAYGNTLEKANQELEKHTAVLEHSRNVMQSYIQMQQLMGLGADYSGLSKMYQMSLDASNASVSAAKQHLDTLKQSRADIEAQVEKYGWTDVLKQQWDDVNEHIRAGEDDLLSATQQALDDAQQMFVNTMNSILQDFDKTLFGQKNGLAKLEDDYSYYQEQQSRYLSTAKELYEVAKLNREIDNSVADATTKTSKERLKALKEEINAKAEAGRLTEYDVQMMELQYKHALALQELEDAKNAKSVVRLTRDENGNFGYQYTADDAAIDDARQKVDDQLQAINELAANRVSEMEQAAVQAERQYRDSLMEIAQDTTLTLEERQAKMEELTRRHTETMQYNQEQYNNASKALLTNQQYVYERYGTSIMTNTGLMQDQMSNAVSSMMEKTGEYANYLSEQMKPGGQIYEAMQKYKSDIGIVQATSGLGGWAGMTASVEDYKDMNEAANEAIKDIEKTLASTLDNINSTTDAWNAQVDVLDTLINKYELLAKAAGEAVRTTAGNIDGETASASDGAATGEKETEHEQQYMFVWGSDGFSGTWSGYDSEQAAREGAIADIGQKIYSTLQAGETDAETAANKSRLTAIVDRAMGTIKITSYRTGGLVDFTGPAWVDGSQDKPELMLNSTDTRNILTAVDFIRKVDINTLTELYRAIDAQTMGMLYSMGGITAQTANGENMTELQQTVTITADFPNATDRNEISAAFEDIINRAAQYAHRTTR